MIYFQKNKTAGFSLVELLLSIGILFLLFSFVSNGFLKRQREMEFEIVADDIYNQLYEAREHSRNFKDGNVYGVHFESDKYEYFKGSVYSWEGVIATADLPGFLQIDSFALNGGGSEIVFEKNSGKTEHYGSFKLVSDDGLRLEIEVSNQGLINMSYLEN